MRTFHMQVDWPHCSVMANRVVLGKVIGQVALPLRPINVEVTLVDAIANPVVAHIHRLGATLLDHVVGETVGRAVVSLHRNRMLLPAEFFKLNANWFGVDAVVEETAEFALGFTVWR